jgi:hypothetical protein
MPIRVNIGDLGFSALSGEFILCVDDTEYNKWGHSDGKVLILRPNGTVEFGYIGGDTDVDEFSGYSPRFTWTTLKEYVVDHEINDIHLELHDAFMNHVSMAKIYHKKASSPGRPPG